VKTVFEILPNILEITPADCELFIMISCSGITYVVHDRKKNSFPGFAFYQFDVNADQTTLTKDVSTAFQEHTIVNRNLESVTVVYTLSDAVVVRSGDYEKKHLKGNLNRLFGDLYESTYFSEEIQGTESTTVYRVPTDLYELMQNQFPNSKHYHQYSLLLQQAPSEADLIQAVFYPGYMIVHARRNGQLQLMSQYNFQTAEDVCWHILNVKEQLQLNEAKLLISGFLDPKSRIYQEMTRYFSNISLDSIPPGVKIDEEMERLPAHFFSYIFRGALCV
jgi:hypothetical protein